MDGGDLATWVGSSFAAVAAAATLWTLKSQRDQIGEQRAFIGEQSATMALERAELHAAAEDRRWSQARRIRMIHCRVEGDGPEDGVWWDVLIENTSDAPVRDLTVRFGTAYLADAVHEVTRSGEQGERWIMPVPLLGPGRRVRFTSQRWPASTAHNNRPSLEFVDDNGLHWTLDYYDDLNPVPPAAPAT